jgi:hypothetical protein
MRSVLFERDREELGRRIASLTPTSSARWGRLTVDRMLAHLCQSARMALGELSVKPKGMRAFQVVSFTPLFGRPCSPPYGAIGCIQDTTTIVRSASPGFTPHSGYDDDTGRTDSTFAPSLGRTLIVSW